VNPVASLTQEGSIGSWLGFLAVFWPKISSETGGITRGAGLFTTEWVSVATGTGEVMTGMSFVLAGMISVMDKMILSMTFLASAVEDSGDFLVFR
jgi:hypothetical protein